MSSSAGGNGFTCVRHPSGQTRGNIYPIATGYAVNIFKGDPVKSIADGTISLCTSDGTRTGTVDGIKPLGVFAGVEYTDANGKPVVSSYWPASTTATNVRAYVYDDQQNVYSVKADGTLAATSVGDELDWNGFAAPGGSTVSGLSSATVAIASIVGAGNQGNFRVIGLDLDPGNAWDDAYTRVLVQIAEHEFTAPAVAV